VIIRQATHEDIPRIVEMGRAFYAASGYEAIAPASIPSIAGLAIVTMEQGVMLVAESDDRVVGMASLFLEPFTFNPEVTVASELAWWIDPDHRGGTLAVRMLHAIGEACQSKGVKVIRMAALESSPPQVAGLYGRAGYVRSDSHYMRILPW
jgi:GNAT superfamily N-acetyltransferase